MPQGAFQEAGALVQECVGWLVTVLALMRQGGELRPLAERARIQPSMSFVCDGNIFC